MKLHAFVAMPFGVKNDSQGRRIDFTRVYQELIKPGLEMALPDISPDNDTEHDTCCGVMPTWFLTRCIQRNRLCLPQKRKQTISVTKPFLIRALAP